MEKKEYILAEREIAAQELAIRECAAKTHADVNQRYGEENYPYFYHLDKVGRLVSKYLPDIIVDKEDILPVLFGAYFHDSIEDARLTYNDVNKIASKFMSSAQAYLATEIVYALTNEKGRNRNERANEKYYEGIRECKYAPLVKACDRLANYNYAKEHKTRMAAIYEKEMDEFIDHINITKYVTEWHPSLTSAYYLSEELISALKSTT